MELQIEEILNGFDFIYCFIVNVLTYSIIKCIDSLNKDKQVNTWIKRLVLVMCILSIGGIYYVLGKDIEVLVNSAILAPVSWSWIFKPLCAKLGVDYNHINDTINK